jgi:hypothetical protein
MSNAGEVKVWASTRRRWSSRGAAFAIVLAAAAQFMAGCASETVWERALERGPEASPVNVSLANEVTVRQVPWERVDRTIRELEASYASSDIHPDEWTSEQKMAAKGTLLRGLQVSQPAASVRVLGRSYFRTTDSMPRSDADLRALGAKLGANMVVYSTRVLGKADKIVSEPVTSNTWGSGWRRDRDGDYRPDTYSESTTSWVPLRITADETGAVAYYLFVE